jgi:hypothetical protein
VEVVPISLVVATLSIAQRVGLARPRRASVLRPLHLCVLVDEEVRDNHEPQRGFRLVFRRVVEDVFDKEVDRLRDVHLEGQQLWVNGLIISTKWLKLV